MESKEKTYDQSNAHWHEIEVNLKEYSFYSKKPNQLL